MNTKGKIKFVHPKGYGFATTVGGDVFFHLSKFRRPRMEYRQGEPTVVFAEETIEPNIAMVGHKINLDVVDGEKGLSAELWCYTDDLEFADDERAAVPYCRLVVRTIIVSRPFAVPAERTWKVRHTLFEDVECEGYLPALKGFVKPIGYQVRIEQRVGDEWKPIECPLGCFNGGPLFDLHHNWSEIV